MAEGTQSIKDLASSKTLGKFPNAIIYPPTTNGKSAKFELRSGFLQGLPIFHGFKEEDPNKHLKEFLLICASMQPEDVDEDIFKLKAFPFTLMDKAKDWLSELPEGTITSWEVLMKEFLEEYFPPSKVIMFRKKITGIVQGEEESYSSYFERFKSLLLQCPQHNFSDMNLLQFFYEGLSDLERQMLDASSGGSLICRQDTIRWIQVDCQPC